MSIFPRPLKKVLDKIIPFSQEDKVPLFNLGSGTYDATTYLRGDGTWATPSGGSGSIPHGTATGTDTYAVTITGVTSYNDGDAFLVRFTNGNTTGATLNINGLGAVLLYRNNDGPIIGGDIENGAEMLCIYNSTTTAFQLIGTTPNTLISYVTNADSVTITKGQAVYAFGGQGDRLTVKLANNSSDATSAQTVGLVLSTSIAAGQKGFIIVNGLLDGLSILPTSTWADGDPVYLGATAGSITNVKPLAPNHLVYLGFVTTANNGSAGRMYVRVQNGYELYELHDVQIGPYGTKDTLWRDTATNLWKNKDIFTLLGAASSLANGYLSSSDWTTFNSKQNALSGTGIVNSTAGTISYLTDNTANWDTAYTNRITSLTTTGSSGAATLLSNTLNIPNYTLTGLGGVPTTRTLTINGTTQDLSADRTFTVSATDPSGYTTIVKPSSQDVTNAGLTIDNDLQFSVTAGGHYLIDMDIALSANNTTGDYIFDFEVSAGTMTGKGTCQTLTTVGGISNIVVLANAVTSTTDISTGSSNASLDDVYTARILFAFTATANGTFRYRFGNVAPAAGRTSRTWKGSIMRYKNLD